MRKFLLSLVCLTALQLPASPAPLTLDDYLRGAGKTEGLAQLTHLRDSFDGSASDLSYLQKLELRLGHDFDEGDQRYALRLNLPAFGEWGARHDLSRAERATIAANRDLAVSESLRERYDRITRLHLLIKQRPLHEELKQTIERKIQALLTTASTKGVDIGSLLGAKDDRRKQDVTLLSLAKEEARLREEILSGFPEGTGLNPDFANFISVSKIREKLKASSASSSPELQALGAQVETLEKRKDLEVSKKRKFLAYVQTSWSAPSITKAPGIAPSVDVGLTLPFFSGSDYDVREATVKYTSEKVALIRAEAKWKSEQRALSDRLHLLIDQYEALLRDSATEKERAKLERLSDLSPFVALSLKEHNLNQQLEAIELEAEIFEAFLDWNELTGGLRLSPFTNVLASDERQ